MTAGSSSGKLLIFEYNGSARSGKGTIVSYLAQKHPEAAVEETGVDYRAITRALLAERVIDLGLDDKTIKSKVDEFGQESLTQIVANRSALVSEYGLKSLYLHDVNEVVASVGKVDISRKAVKAGFRKRVEAVRDKGAHKILLVDGRDLAKVLADIDNTKLLLRTFVTCTVAEAARRECLRSGVGLDSEESRNILVSIDRRTQADALRDIDPVKPDIDALDYWHPPRGVDQVDIGRLAAKNGKQIYLDTTLFSSQPDSKEAMCQVAEQIFKSALLTINH